MSNAKEHIESSLALRFLRWFCPDHLYEEIEGDLLQCFHRDVKSYGETKAKRRLLWNAIRFCRPGIILRNKFSRTTTSFDMVRHFFRIFFRAAVKHPGYSFINVSGLVVGLAASILVMLWVVDEISYDDIHRDKERIFQVMGHHTFPGGTETYDNTPGPLAGALKDLPEVEASARLTFAGGKVLFQYGDKSLYESGAYADAAIVNIFTLPLVAGNAADPLPHKNAIAISRKLADKYFRDEEATGKVLRVNSNQDAVVTAVFEDIPDNATLQFEFLLPYALYADGDSYNEEWGAWTGGRTFVKLYDAATSGTVNSKIDETLTKPNIWPRWDSNVELFLFPMSDWRLQGNFTDGRQQGGRIMYIKIFTLVAGFILLIACVNFMNLATARSMIRAREIGVRKVVGAARKSITGQFMLESLLHAGIALFIALPLVYFLLPFFNDLTAKNIVPDYTNPTLYTIIMTITVLAGLLAGSYPSLFLSSLQVIHVLKGKLSGHGGAGTRKALVVFQFSASIVLIVFALVVHQQVEYMRNKNLGFDRENIVYIRTTAALQKDYEAFAAELRQHSVIERVSRSDNNPMDNFFRMVLADDAWPGKRKEDNIVFKVMRCDDEFLPALGFALVKGRNFSRENISDTASYIISEEAARKMNLSDPIGEYLKAPRPGRIVGVVKDFHSSELRGPIEPVIIAMRPDETNRVFIRYASGTTENALQAIRSVYKKYEANFPMEYSFMDEPFGRQYKDELTVGRLSASFTVIAIFISFLGLTGLSSFTAERRTREIGIRKVMGATVQGIILLLCKDFVRLILFSIGTGFVAGYYFGSEFLNQYAFHVTLNVWTFIIPAAVLLVLTLATVSVQSIKAAVTDPAKTLKMN